MTKDELNKRRDELSQQYLEIYTQKINDPALSPLRAAYKHEKDAVQLVWDSGFNAATEILTPEITEYKERYSHACIELRFYDQLLDERNKEIKQLTAQLSKAREVLEVVVKRGDECGHDARKLGIPLGIYVVCKEALNQIEKKGTDEA